MAEPIEMPFALWTRMGPRKHVLDGGPDTPVKGHVLSKMTCQACPMTLLWAVQKQLNQSRCIWVVGSSGLKEPCI